MGYRKVGIGPLEVLVRVDSEVTKWWHGSKEPGAEAQELGDRTPVPASGDDLADRIKSIEWYHTIDLGNGYVTPGVFDHRPYIAEYKLPSSLEGKRVLDVASMDGHWAFLFEKLGAREVIALDVETFADIDYPPAARARIGADRLASRKTKEGFHLAKEVLGSKVQLQYMSVYDLSPERLGKFDFVFCSDLLLHLTNPVRALQNICRVTAGCAHIVEYYHPVFPGKTLHYEGGKKDCVWWSFSYGCLEQMVADAGFCTVEALNKFAIGGTGQEPWMWHGAFRAIP